MASYTNAGRSCGFLVVVRQPMRPCTLDVDRDVPMKCAVLLLITPLAGYVQFRGEPPRYEVASIKPSTTDVPLAFRIEPDGTLAATGITLQRLMMTAYNVQGFRIAG